MKNNGLLNFPQINFGNHMIFPHYYNPNLKDRIN